MTETLTTNKPATTLLRLASGNGPVTRTVLTTPLRDALPSEIPIIDIAGAFSDALADRKAVAQQIRAAATTSGFFYITNHNIPASDDVGGLQVLNREGQWIRASPVPGTFVVNIADYLQRITNDLYVSTVHRAVNRSGRERISMPFFFGFGLHESCAVIKSCLKDGEEPRYEDIGCDAWVKKRAQAMHKTDADDEDAN
ncbi:2OG-Fe(II) oxygenase [Verticillium dahliae VdLs.17]|uniref:2OG-Fe(II) oxygenase n=1 Tax=Verticillium dahliae (strain VdLs.17 / ATCC MYA-4575 / FGSC 10137) TaxID=498257 RepID=G2XGM4_VERDV|nr:2OG-Fe(II) oxygenase [Verticillium dahliae VdLs.17]EGY18972.1 2OG-Fe(II) oxygenase [Verticillium dahliae VdLs.17]